MKENYTYPLNNFVVVFEREMVAFVVDVDVVVPCSDQDHQRTLVEVAVTG